MRTRPLLVLTLAVTASVLASLSSLTVVAGAGEAPLTADNNTPFPSSDLIKGARWTTKRYNAQNQAGDILLTTWASDNRLYVEMDDGGIYKKTGPQPPKFWKNSTGKIYGKPPHIKFRYVGDPNKPPPIGSPDLVPETPDAWRGRLGPYYSLGLTSVNHVFYATQANDWDWDENTEYKGLHGIAYSKDLGKHWRFPNKPFPDLAGNLNFIEYGKDRPHPDGYIYAIGNDREFDSSKIVLGRSLPGPANVTDPSRWQWFSGLSGGQPQWSTDIDSAQPVFEWYHHITYPQMTYAPGLNRYLLTLSYSYTDEEGSVYAQDQKMVKDGMELVVLESENPWGPFKFAFRQPYWGPSNGYGGGFPIPWMSPNGRDLWMKWAANFAGCSEGLDCSGVGGFNYRRLHLS